jgi:hypothetical protein
LKYGGGFLLLFSYSFANLNAKNDLKNDELVILEKKTILPY